MLGFQPAERQGVTIVKQTIQKAGHLTLELYLTCYRLDQPQPQTRASYSCTCQGLHWQTLPPGWFPLKCMVMLLTSRWLLHGHHMKNRIEYSIRRTNWFLTRMYLNVSSVVQVCAQQRNELKLRTAL